MQLRFLLCFFVSVLLSGCSGRSGYQILNEVAYQKCLKQSLHPVEECVAPPSYESYKEEMEQNRR